MTQLPAPVYCPPPPQPPPWRRARTASALQRVTAWSVWPVMLLLPLLVLHLRTSADASGLLTVLLVTGLWWPTAAFGATVSLLVTLRAACVRPFAAGPCTTGMLLGYWVCFVALVLSTGDVGEHVGTWTASPLVTWGWSPQLTSALCVWSLTGVVPLAAGTLVAAVVELVLPLVAARPERAPGAGAPPPPRQLTGGRHIPTALTVPRHGTGPRERNPKRS